MTVLMLWRCLLCCFQYCLQKITKFMKSSQYMRKWKADPSIREQCQFWYTLWYIISWDFHSASVEASYANSLNKKLIPIRLQPKYRPDGWLAFLLAGAFHYDLYDHSEYESKIRSFLNALGSDATTSTVFERPLTGEGECGANIHYL